MSGPTHLWNVSVPIEDCFLLNMEEGMSRHRECMASFARSTLVFLGILLTATEKRL